MRNLRQFLCPCLTILAALLTIPFEAGAASATRFAPHRAIYELSLKSTSGGTDVVGVGGQMGFEWRDACDGWAIHQRNLMILQGAEGSENRIDTTLTTWEAKDGSSFRFIVKKHFGAGGGEMVEGKAVRDDAGKVKAVFTAPDAAEIDLDPATLFPTRHTFELLDRIAAGERIYSVPLFDGTEFEPESLVSAFVGKKLQAGESDHALTSGAYWPLRLAFFGPGNREETPDYELTVDLHPNGVARRLEIHFADFVVDVKLVHIEALEAPVC